MPLNKVKNAIILHGTMGSPEENWFAWLKTKLEEQKINVWLPQLPITDKPDPKNVIPFILNNCPFRITTNTIIIGHSSGAVEILHLLPKIESKIMLAVLVGSFKDNDFLKWAPNGSLFSMPFDFERCKFNCQKFVYIHSDNDPFCPIDQAKFLQNQTGGKLVVIPHQKHFSVSTMGETYHKFPKLLEIIKENV